MLRLNRAHPPGRGWRGVLPFPQTQQKQPFQSQGVLSLGGILVNVFFFIWLYFKGGFSISVTCSDPSRLERSTQLASPSARLCS